MLYATSFDNALRKGSHAMVALYVVYTHCANVGDKTSVLSLKLCSDTTCNFFENVSIYLRFYYLIHKLLTSGYLLHRLFGNQHWQR